MNKILEAIYIGMAGFFVAVLLPKTTYSSIRSFIAYWFASLRKEWKLAICILLLVFLIWYQIPYLKQNVLFLLTAFLLASLLVLTISLSKFLKKRYPPLNVAVYGCYSNKNNEFLIADLDADLINKEIQNIIKEISATLFIYRRSYQKIYFIQVPKFVATFWGFEKLDAFIGKQTKSRNHVAALYFVRNIYQQKLNTYMQVDSSILHNDISQNVLDILNGISSSPGASSEMLIRLNLKIFLMLFGQASFDFFLLNNKIEELHLIIDDSISLLRQLKTISETLPIEQQEKFNRFLDFWSTHFERYKALAFIRQNQFSAAITRVFKAIRLNPYYPFDSYGALKLNYSRQYSIEVFQIVKDMPESNLSATDKDHLTHLQRLLATQIQFGGTKTNEEIVKEIISNDSSDIMVASIESELVKLGDSHPYFHVIRYEILKYLRKGEQRFSEMYADRIEECLNSLKKFIDNDPDFPVFRSKYGVMMMMRGSFCGHREWIDEGFKIWTESFHFLSEAGVDFKKNN